MTKIITKRNSRISFEDDEIEFLKGLVNVEINKNQKFDRERMYFLLKLAKKFEVK